MLFPHPSTLRVCPEPFRGDRRTSTPATRTFMRGACPSPGLMMNDTGLVVEGTSTPSGIHVLGSTGRTIRRLILPDDREIKFNGESGIRNALESISPDVTIPTVPAFEAILPLVD